MKKKFNSFILAYIVIACTACGANDASESSSAASDEGIDSLTTDESYVEDTDVSEGDNNAPETVESTEDCPECDDSPTNTTLCGIHTCNIVMACNIFGDIDYYGETGLVNVEESTEEYLFFTVNPSSFCLMDYDFVVDIEDFEGFAQSISDFTQLFPMGYGYDGDIVEKGYNPCDYDTITAWLSDFGNGMTHSFGFKVNDNKSTDYDLVLNVTLDDTESIGNLSVTLSTTDRAVLRTVPHAVFKEPYICVYPLTNQGNSVYPMTFYYKRGR